MIKLRSPRFCLVFLLYIYRAVAFLQLRSVISPQRLSRAIAMVRNIDLPECLVFYSDGVLDGEDEGLQSLMEECKDTDTALLSISSNEENRAASFPGVSFRYPTRAAPNPKDLWEAIESLTIQPRPFGGSAGFGSKLPDPERNPMPARTVVFCKTVEQTRAARACGMRVMCFNDNELADAIVDSYDFYLDDIATPGSFWLNPPHPRDDEGNKVDVEDLIEQLDRDKLIEGGDPEGSATAGDDTEDDELQRILADMAPL